jgi:hypothetical protein
VVNDHDPIEDDDRAGADRVTPLERRSRWLLRAYPAEYRRERAEEMLGTLLETTTDGQTWPRPRDAQALVMGGLRARAAQNRRLSATANLRIAVMAGVSFYLVMMAAEYLGVYLSEFRLDPRPAWPWTSVLVTALLVSTVLLAWTARRRIAALSGLAAAVAIYFANANDGPFRSWIPLAVCVVAVVLLAPRSARPPRTWLFLSGALAVAELVSVALVVGPVAATCAELAVGAISVAWLAVDARLAAAVATFVLTYFVAQTALFFNAGLLPYVLAIVAIAALPAWLTWRQSGRGSATDAQ